MDDPTSSLDNLVTECIMKTIVNDKFWNERTFVISTNNLGTLKYFDRVIFLEEGKVLYFDTPEKIRLTPEFASISLEMEEQDVLNYNYSNKNRK